MMTNGLSYLLVLTALIFSGVSHPALAAETPVAFCHASKITPTIYGMELPADIKLTLISAGGGKVFGRLEGFYQEPSGSKTTMDDVARRSKVSPLSIPGGPNSFDFSYAATLRILIEKLATLNQNTRGLSLSVQTLYTPLKTRTCSIIDGEEFCSDVAAPFGQYMEFRNLQRQRVAAAGSLAGGWYTFDCD